MFKCQLNCNEIWLENILCKLSTKIDLFQFKSYYETEVVIGFIPYQVTSKLYFSCSVLLGKDLHLNFKCKM